MDRYEFDRMRVYAMQQVKKAVQEGLLVDLKQEWVKCSDCEKRADRYDHRDYESPLEVDPVCCSCNTKRGPAKQGEEFFRKTEGVKWSQLDAGEGYDPNEAICHIELPYDDFAEFKYDSSIERKEIEKLIIDASKSQYKTRGFALDHESMQILSELSDLTGFNNSQIMRMALKVLFEHKSEIKHRLGFNSYRAQL